MSLAVFWADDAIETFNSIVLFIENKWSIKDAEKFVRHSDKIIDLIAEQPYMYKASLNNNVRQAIITKQTSMFYEVHHEFITILFFWDNRQEPAF
jgi:plasmid stabilization system protein ParE